MAGVKTSSSGKHVQIDLSPRDGVQPPPLQVLPYTYMGMHTSTHIRAHVHVFMCGPSTAFDRLRCLNSTPETLHPKLEILNPKP